MVVIVDFARDSGRGVEVEVEVKAEIKWGRIGRSWGTILGGH